MNATPDLLTFESGETVTADEWTRRRAELYDAIIPHEYGGMPDPGQVTEAVLLGESEIRNGGGVRFLSVEVHTRFSDTREFSFPMHLWVPPGANGRLPVIINGDGCWRYLTDVIVRQMVERGNIVASFDRTYVAADNPDLYRDTGIFRLFPKATYGALSAWAWGYHRCVDALSNLPIADTARIAVTGHSRGGKTVILAGATDERIAVTNPNDSGCGGSGLNRLKCDRAEVVDDFFKSRNIFWFGSGFADFRHRDAELPYDQHFLHALIAPRGLLIDEAYEDYWANPPGSYTACRSAQAVYALLGAEDKIGWAVREGGHGHFAADFEALLDFTDRHFHSRSVARDFQRELFPRLDELLNPRA